MAEIGALPIKRSCWVDVPFKSTDGYLLGHAQLKRNKDVPEWAENTTSELVLNRNSVAVSLTVTAYGCDYRLEQIIQSITGRFGKARRTDQHGLTTARWATSEIDIHLSRLDDRCRISFSLPEYSRLAAAEAEEEERRRQALPKTP